MKNSIKKVISQNGALIHLISAKDKGREAWYWVLINKPDFKTFMETLSDDSVPLTQYGKILYKGWGVQPPETINQAIIDEYM